MKPALYIIYTAPAPSCRVFFVWEFRRGGGVGCVKKFSHRNNIIYTCTSDNNFYTCPVLLCVLFSNTARISIVCKWGRLMYIYYFFKGMRFDVSIYYIAMYPCIGYMPNACRPYYCIYLFWFDTSLFVIFFIFFLFHEQSYHVNVMGGEGGNHRRLLTVLN